MRKTPVLLALPVLFGLGLAACQSGLTTGALDAPRPVAEPTASAPVARGPFVAAGNPLAVEAGMEVLRRGGSAVDAAVAIQAMLGLVEPQSSGISAGGFLMHFDAGTGETVVYDGRDTAPAAATPALFQGDDGRPLPLIEFVLTGRSTGVPGAIAALAMAQEEHGTLPWSELFTDAERLARDGFIVSPRLASAMVASEGQERSPWATAYFTRTDGERYKAGDTLRNPAYAATLAILARDGIEALRTGPIVDAIIEAVRTEPRPGSLTHADLAAYRPIRREALCRPFRLHVICVPPPPSSGVALLQLLAMAETAPVAADLAGGETSPAAWIAFVQIQRLAYADLNRYVADPAFVGVPVAGLLDPGYVAARAALAPGLTGAAGAGTPPGGIFRAADATTEPAGTSHFVVVDAEGDAISMTATNANGLGSGRMAAGFFLNSQLANFSSRPARADSGPAANAMAPGKRPRSSMIPVIILDQQGRLVGALGSPGSASILAYTAKVLIATLVWDMPMQAAIDLPNLVAKGSGFGADTAGFDPTLVAGLAAGGIPLAPDQSEMSGVHGGLWRRGPEGWSWDGGADHRREGVARTQ